MPANYAMYWDGRNGRRRWQKVYKNRRYVVSCRQLGLPESRWTKEGSYREANAWWEAKRAAIDGERAREAEHFVSFHPSGPVGPEVAAVLLGAIGATAREPGGVSDVPGERSVGHQAERWLTSQRRRVARGKLSPVEWSSRRT